VIFIVTSRSLIGCILFSEKPSLLGGVCHHQWIADGLFVAF
jgi:hypothetical protein